MTWVCAVSSLTGGCALYSDVQVTFRNGSTKDLVQKAFPLTNSMAAGFAGSVRIGFSLLDSLASFLKLPPEIDPEQVGWDPRWVSVNWAPLARSVFESADPAERRLGATILAVAASPSENCGLGAKFYFTRFSAPDFKPGIMSKPFKVCSIGSGAGIIGVPRQSEATIQVGRAHFDASGGGGSLTRLGTQYRFQNFTAFSPISACRNQPAYAHHHRRTRPNDR